MRWQQGGHNSGQLWRELYAQGFTVRPHTLRDWKHKHYGPRKCRDQPPLSVPIIARTSPRHVAWRILKRPEQAHLYLDQLNRGSPEIARCAGLAREFFRIIRERDIAAWPALADDFRTFLLCEDTFELPFQRSSIESAKDLAFRT